MPNGYSEAVRVFTKLLKPPFSILRSHGYLPVVIVDNPHLQGHTFSTNEGNTNAAADLFQFLGFTIHPEKSVLILTQEIEFLGFVLNSTGMKIKLTDCNSGKIISKTKELLYEEKLPYGKLHYRVNYGKISSLKFQKSKYNAFLCP